MGHKRVMQVEEAYMCAVVSTNIIFRVYVAAIFTFIIGYFASEHDYFYLDKIHSSTSFSTARIMMVAHSIV